MVRVHYPLLILIATLSLISCGREVQPLDPSENKVNQIIGSTKQRSDDFASVVQIKSYIDGELYGLCSGTIVCSKDQDSCSESKFIKTSAHCFASKQTREDFTKDLKEKLIKDGAIEYSDDGNELTIHNDSFLDFIPNAFDKHLAKLNEGVELYLKYDGEETRLLFDEIRISQQWLSRSYFNIIASILMLPSDLEVIQDIKQADDIFKHDKAEITLQKSVKGIKIYPQATKDELAVHLQRNGKVHLAGWGLTEEEFTLGLLPFGRDYRKTPDDRFNIKVNSLSTIRESGFFQVGSFSSIFDYHYDQKGACQGDSGGGAFIKTKKGYVHVGTITAVQGELCGGSKLINTDGSNFDPAPDFHTSILFW